MEGLFKPPGRDVWMYRFTPLAGAKQVRKSTKKTDEAEAIVAAKKIKADYLKKREDAGDFEVEIDEYLALQRRDDRLSKHSVTNRRYTLVRFFEEIEKKNVGEATAEDAQSWYDSLKGTEESKHTYIRWLKAFYKCLIVARKVEENPFAAVTMARARPTARHSTLTKEQVATLIDACRNDGLRFVLFCGFHAGMRKEEVIEARPEWFDLQTNHIHIGPTPTWIPKDRERRSVPLSPAFRAFLKDYGKPSPYMLAPEVEPGIAAYRYDFERAYKTLLRKTNLKCTFHDARRTFASHLVSAGMSVYKVARYLGDGVAVVEKHYGHLQPDAGEFDRMMSI